MKGSEGNVVGPEKKCYLQLCIEYSVTLVPVWQILAIKLPVSVVLQIKSLYTWHVTLVVYDI